jgi:hypothetical protein
MMLAAVLGGMALGAGGAGMALGLGFSPWIALAAYSGAGSLGMMLTLCLGMRQADRLMI